MRHIPGLEQSPKKSEMDALACFRPANASMTTSDQRLEIASERDRFHTYCLWEYAPVAPAVGKWQPANLLYHTFDFTSAGDRAYETVDCIRRAIGIGNTVWGVKQLGDTIAWEFYFYDYDRLQRQRSATGVLTALAPLFPSPVRVNERLNYFMFSLDFTVERFTRGTPLDAVHLYIGNVGSNVSSGMNYLVTEHHRTLENFYFFFDARKHLDEVAVKVASSAFLDDPDFPLSEIIRPELAACDTICVANKSRNDCIYFAGVNVNQFLWFLERFGYPGPIVSHVRKNRAQLDHLLFDVGFDYRVEAGRVRVLKTGYYGTF
jgi:hypothetical protein